MSKANSLVSIHGAGITNILFMKKGGKILELRNINNRSANCFYTLACDLDLDFYYLPATPISSKPEDSLYEINIADVTIDITDLKRALEQMHCTL